MVLRVYNAWIKFNLLLKFIVYQYTLRDAKAMLEYLTPLFPMDYLLPRSFVAALEFEQLKDVVPTELIPVEVTLAALYYFSKHYKVKTHKNEVSILIGCSL